ncbi:MAG: PilZ domain-containing protein [Planctomycetota bacterium]|nr:PilZ domain-containing protein [Planctomycetota bacterium]
MNLANDMDNRSDGIDRWWEGGKQPPNPLPFERRQHERWPMQGSARAILLDSDHFGQVSQLALLDYSAGGLGAISAKPITPGSCVSIGFTSHGYAAERGIVVKCAPCGHGYRVAIRFELRQAA